MFRSILLLSFMLLLNAQLVPITPREPFNPKNMVECDQLLESYKQAIRQQGEVVSSCDKNSPFLPRTRVEACRGWDMDAPQACSMEHKGWCDLANAQIPAVESCRAKVRKYLFDQDAEKRRREAEAEKLRQEQQQKEQRAREQARREAEQRQHDAEQHQREAQRLALEKQQDADQKAERVARQRAAEAKTAEEKRAAEADAKAAADRIRQAQDTVNQIVTAQTQADQRWKAGQSSRTSSSTFDSGTTDESGKQTLAELTSPFGVKPTPPSSERGPIDPFPKVSAHAPLSRDLSDTNGQDREPTKEQYELAVQTAETLLEKGIDMLTGDIRDAPKIITNDSRRLETYLASAEATRSRLEALDGFLKTGGYAAQTVKVVNAESDYRRKEALGDLGFDVAKDIAGDGVKDYAAKVFGQEAVAVIASGPVGWTVSVAAEVMKPVKTGLDPQEIIRTTPGEYSLAEKQQQLGDMWDMYIKTPGSVGLDNLLDCTNIVFKEATAK